MPASAPLERYRNLIFIVVTLAILSGIGALLAYRPAATQITIIPPAFTPTPLPTNTPGPMKIYVTGAVNDPASVFTLAAGSRVQDAIDAAGGTTDDADMARINMAAAIHDGDQIDVPALKGNGSAAIIPPTVSGPININTANIDELRGLPGCSPALAQRIVDYREKNGPFKSMTDVGHVSGVGKTKVRDWASLVVFK